MTFTCNHRAQCATPGECELVTALGADQKTGPLKTGQRCTNFFDKCVGHTFDAKLDADYARLKAERKPAPARCEFVQSSWPSCRVVTVAVPMEVHIDTDGRVAGYTNPNFDIVQTAYNVSRGQAMDPRWPLRDTDIERNILAGRLNLAEITTYLARVGIKREDIQRDHFHE